MPGMVNFAFMLLLLLLTSGCATTYIPISWGISYKVKKISSSDPFLTTLFNRYDANRNTLRVAGNSFDQVMMPSQVEHHLGAYRPDTRLIYRNLYKTYTDDQLRSLLLHELAHHVWHTGMSQMQREQWRGHLEQNPSPLQAMVRAVYPYGSDYDSEDFAFVVEHARNIDIEELARLKVIDSKERDSLLTQRMTAPPPVTPAALKLTSKAGTAPPDSAAHTQKGHHPAP